MHLPVIQNSLIIASNLFQLFKLRRIKNHVKIQRELVRLLLKGLYLLKKHLCKKLDKYREQAYNLNNDLYDVQYTVQLNLILQINCNSREVIAWQKQKI